MLKRYGVSFVREGQPPLYASSNYHPESEEMFYGWSNEVEQIHLVDCRESVRRQIASLIKNYKEKPKADHALEYLGKVRREDDNINYRYEEDKLGAAFFLSTPIGEVVSTKGKLVIVEVVVTPTDEFTI